MIQQERIGQLMEQGKSHREISFRITGLHRKTVKQYINQLPVCGQAVLPDHTQGVDSTDQTSASSCSAAHQLEDSRLAMLTSYFSDYDRELMRTGVTRQLLWHEYRQTHAQGYGYTQFCEHYTRHRARLPRGTSMHLDHAFGDCLQVDFAGLSKACDKPAYHKKNIITTIITQSAITYWLSATLSIINFDNTFVPEG